MGVKLALLIDGNNLAWRANYAYNLSFRGQDVSALYGVVRMVQALVKHHKPRSVIYCWDGGTPGFRKRLVPEYKASRRHKDDGTYTNFVRQAIELREVLPFFGLYQVYRRGLEADDLVYHASRMLDERSIIVTADEDLLQAVDEKTSVLKPGKKDLLHTPEEMEIAPEDMVEWKVLQGDSSDNIRGVSGVGPKTATKIVHGEPVSERIAERVKAFYESGAYDAAYDCMDLSVDRAGAKHALLSSEYVPFDWRKCKSFCIKYGFTSLLEGNLGQIFGKLREPMFNTRGLAIPRVWDYKRAPK